MRWLAGLAIPGAAHWLNGERGKAVVYAAMVLTLVSLGAWWNGSNTLPNTAELDGVDGTARLMFLGGAAVKAFAGLPFWALSLGGYSQSFIAGIGHEYGTKLLTMAGLVNLLALADAFGRKAVSR